MLPQFEQQYKELCDQRQAIYDQCAPLEARRNELVQKIAPEMAEIESLGEQIREIKKDLYDIQMACVMFDRQKIAEGSQPVTVVDAVSVDVAPASVTEAQ